MRILVVSDTHGRLRELREVLQTTGPYDYLIHCGDTEGQEDLIEEEAGIPCTIVCGNNDYFTDLPEDAEVEIGKYRIFVTHGHHYGVSMGTEHLIDEALSRGCNIACYGHTHRPDLDLSDPSVTVLNPGSLSYPRQFNRRPGYLVIEIDRFGEAHFTQEYL